MSPRYAIVNFVPFFVIGFTFIDCHHIPRIGFNGLRETSFERHVLQTNCNFLTVMSETAVLKFPLLPDDFLEWTSWLHSCMHISHGTTIRHKNANQEVEEVTFWGVFLMGRRLSRNVEMWPAARANLDELTSEAIIANAPTLTPEERAFLQTEEGMFHFNNQACHCKLQKALRGPGALVAAVGSHALSPEINFFHSRMHVLDLYQGSRLMARITELLHGYLAAKLHQIIPAALQIPLDIKSNPDIKSAEFHESVLRLEKYIAVLTFAEYPKAEQTLVTHFCKALRDVRRPVILSIVQAVQEADDFTLDSDCLRTTLIAQWPIDPTLLDVSVNLVAPPDGVRKTYTHAEQQAYIAKLQSRLTEAATEKKALNQEIQALRRRVGSMAGSLATPPAPRAQRPDGAAQGGNQRSAGGQRRGRPRRDGTANLSEDLDANLAFFAGADDPAGERPWYMPAAVEFYHDFPIVSVLLLAGLLITMFAMSITIVYGVEFYLRSLPGNFVPDYEPAEPPRTIADRIEAWLTSLVTAGGLGCLGYLKIYRKHLTWAGSALFCSVLFLFLTLVTLQFWNFRILKVLRLI
jgi:hypothetical protein